ncbi:MAG: hypothetical protein ACFE95_03455 [Candidatus Hodarchaeota archaeon]
MTIDHFHLDKLESIEHNFLYKYMAKEHVKENIDPNQKGLENSDLINQLADRVLLFLSFKDTNTQNLRFLWKVLGVQTRQEKKNNIQEIFRLIQEGIVYIPRGLPELIDFIFHFDQDSPKSIENIDLSLIFPFEQLIQYVQWELSNLL